MHSRRVHAPQPSVPEPRLALLQAVRTFVREAASCAGVKRIALVGSLATPKPTPKDADVLVTIDAGMDLERLARAGRRLKGAGQSINLGADVFLADGDGRYIGRICRYRECRPRALCRARNCGARQHLNDDLGEVTLSPALIAAPPVELWPQVVRRGAVPQDVEAVLLSELDAASSPDKAAGAARRMG